MERLRRLVRFLHWMEDAVLVAIFFTLVGLAVSQILLRNFFDGGWIWVDSALRVLVLWLALWGAGLAARYGHHIRIELAPHYLPEKWHRPNLVVCDLACSLISGLIAYHSALFVYDEYLNGDTAFAQIPVWVCELIIPVTLSLLALRFMAQALATALHVEEVLE